MTVFHNQGISKKGHSIIYILNVDAEAYTNDSDVTMEWE